MTQIIDEDLLFLYDDLGKDFSLILNYNRFLLPLSVTDKYLIFHFQIQVPKNSFKLLSKYVTMHMRFTVTFKLDLPFVQQRGKYLPDAMWKMVHTVRRYALREQLFVKR